MTRLRFRRRDGRLARWRAPRTKLELRRYGTQFFGITLAPAVHPDCVARGHRAPLDVAWAILRAKHPETGAHMPICVVQGSRGLSGKSTMLATISTLEGLVGLDSVVLGGSLAQSERVHAVAAEFRERDAMIRGHRLDRPLAGLIDPPTRTTTTFPWTGATRTIIPASSRAARSPHPHRLRCDEIDEMSLEILDAALGQTMSEDLEAKPTQTALVSTHQHPDGTMTEVLRRAADRGWPVFEYCYRDCLEEVGGWLTWAMVNTKRHEVSEAMWLAEYELQEPSPEGRAINTEAVVAQWDPAKGFAKGAPGEYIEIPCCPASVDRKKAYERTGNGDPPAPCRDHRYATGADWGKDVDWTIITTYRVVGSKLWLVAWERSGREPWPIMHEKLNARVRRYPGPAAHDATGMGGKAAHDYLTVPADPVVLVGRDRQALLSDYVQAIEHGEIVGPRIEYAYHEHRYVTNDDLFRSGSAFHAPDSVVAGALALRAAARSIAVDLNPDALRGPSVLDGLR